MTVDWFYRPLTLRIPEAVADWPLSRMRAWADARARAECLRLGLTLLDLPDWTTDIAGGRHYARARLQVRPITTTDPVIDPDTAAAADAWGWCANLMHPMVPENTLPQTANGARCRACADAGKARRDQRKRDHERARKARLKAAI